MGLATCRKRLTFNGIWMLSTRTIRLPRIRLGMTCQPSERLVRTLYTSQASVPLHLAARASLTGSPDKGKRKPKVKRSALQREQTLQAKSRENAGFNRGTQSAIATLPSGEQIVLMLPAKRRRGSKYAGGLS